MNTDLLSSIGDRMWTEKEAAYLLGVSLHTLWRWRREKRITFFLLPCDQVRYRRQDLENLLAVSLRPRDEAKGEHRIRRMKRNKDNGNK